MNPRAPSRLRFARLGCALAALLAAGTAGAALTVCPKDGPCGQVRAIDDDEMAAVAGKFTIAGEVVGMNLMLRSAWQAADGQLLEASATLAVRLPASGQAGVWTDAKAGGGEPNPATPTQAGIGTVIGGAGLRNVNGVAQLIQVAGDGNGAANRSTIEVGTGALAAPGGNGQTGAIYRANNGAQASVRLSDSGAELRLTLPSGVAEQHINTAGSLAIAQSIRIAADRQQTLNTLQLQVQILPPSSAMQAAQGLARSLSMLRGH